MSLSQFCGYASCWQNLQLKILPSPSIIAISLIHICELLAPFLLILTLSPYLQSFEIDILVGSAGADNISVISLHLLLFGLSQLSQSVSVQSQFTRGCPSKEKVKTLSMQCSLLRITSNQISPFILAETELVLKSRSVARWAP